MTSAPPPRGRVLSGSVYFLLFGQVSLIFEPSTLQPSVSPLSSDVGRLSSTRPHTLAHFSPPGRKDESTRELDGRLRHCTRQTTARTASATKGAGPSCGRSGRVWPLARCRLILDCRLTFHSCSQQAQEAMKNLPPEQQEQAKGMLANAQAGAGALAGTAGGAVKGVVDTAGNTVRTPKAPHHELAGASMRVELRATTC